MKILKKLLKWSIVALALFLCYVIGCLLHGTATDFQPEEKIALPIKDNTQASIITKNRLTFLNWNVGYGGLGAKSNFFYDDGNPFFFSNGKMVRSPKSYVEENIAGISAFIAAHPADFVLLQEVDYQSKRSYFINQHEQYLAQLPNYNAHFAVNYKVQRVVIPVCEPWQVMGKMESGLSSYAKYQAHKSTRYQFPGSYGWPDYIFHLDRCLSVQRYQTAHPDGKELIVVNTHNSAYDGGTLKNDEMAYFKQLVLAEYNKGNYVVVGGDWNQTPPKLPFDAASKAVGIPTDSTYNPANIAPDFMPEGWQWAFDPTVPTNRQVIDILEYGKTAVSLVDFYLVSPNISIKKVEGKNLKFAYSDHNPILLEIELQGLDSLNNSTNEL
ncbi:endonuclease/exonuclease/phosphatase family protein [Aureispira anguillae]|nr:endonuclease/exonuclease/phosphatase family protein [Aureispira anguillae]